MKPNEHIKLPEDELITHIRESLMAHEEEYAPGAWENFIQEKPKKRGLLFWLGSLSSAAAVLLIGFGLFFTLNKNTVPKNPELSVIKPLQKAPGVPEAADVKPKEDVESGQEEHSVVVAGLNSSSTEAGLDSGYPKVAMEGPIEVKTPDQYIIAVPNAKNEVALNSTTVKQGEVVVQEQVVAQVPQAEKKRSFQEFLNEESKHNGAVKRDNSVLKRQSKWEMGLVVAPSFGNNKELNMGYGLSMAYALSDKVSISSGVSYNQMGASRSIVNENPPNMALSMDMGAGMAKEEKELKSVSARLRGIDIPLELKYHLSKKLYANVGVSAFAVIDQKQQNTFFERKVESQGYSLESGSAKTTVLNRTVSEEAPKEEVKNDPYLGFYNFSVGYKQKISKGKSFSVEPFVKLPMKELKQENLYLIGTGVRLKFDF
ncbi:hypothetical protein [Pedobacter caeni]|nr:hypothetical protein [Pedobacter caeni]